MESDTVADAEAIAGAHLRRLRLARGWSQREVADRMRAFGYRWGQSTVGKIETAARPLRVNELASLATLFDVSPLALLLSGDPSDGLSLPDEELSLDGVNELLAVLQKASEAGDDRLHELQVALDNAARQHRFAQMDYDTAHNELESIRKRIPVLLARREELTAGEGGLR